MFGIITKQEYWDWLTKFSERSIPAAAWNRVFRGRLQRTRYNLSLWIAGLRDREYTLKTVQDLFMIHRLDGMQGKRILEIGGGRSRVLPRFHRTNECWLADRFEGQGNGPARVPRLPGVRIIRAFLGEFSHDLPENYFDVVFSISVIEHVPTDDLENFFRDCARVMAPGARLIHAIDLYLFDPADDDLPPGQVTRQRMDAYLSFSDRPDLGLRLIAKPEIDEHVRFSCRMASLPDNVMHVWHRNRPGPARQFGQLVSLRAEWEKC